MLKRKINQRRGSGSGRKIVKLNRVVREGLTEEVTFKGLKEVREGTIGISEGRVFQAEGTNRTKVLW